MTDIGQAKAAEAFIERCMPNFHVADTTLDKGYLLVEGAPPHPEAPDENWLLEDIGARSAIVGGRLSAIRFVQDAITHRNILEPLFIDLKRSIAEVVMAEASKPAARVIAKKYKPVPGMTLREALTKELIRDPHISGEVFDEHDAMDMIHATPAAIVCDLVLLDAGWCHKVSVAAQRMAKGGVKGRIARCYSKKSVHEFLLALETWKNP